jgi:Methyltransferase domain
VDTWQGSPEHQFDPDVVDDQLYQRFVNNMKPVKGLYRARRMTSVEAAATYADNSLDFVWLDADHSYRAVSEDIRAWQPKIRPGGWLGGHDHSFREAPGVPIACKLLLGQYYVIPPTAGAQWPVNSWLWQKPTLNTTPVTNWLTWIRQMLV